MPNKLINENVDIYKFPLFDSTDNENKSKEITIGDLHGNAMKLLFMLVKHGIATNINDTDYQKLIEIYVTSVNKLKTELLNEFNSILANMEFHTESKIRLLGDELADKGNNDYFTLKILERLNKADVPIEIILSNHSVEFIEAYEKQDKFLPQMLFGFARSMQNMQILVDNNLVTRKDIINITSQAYKPTLKALSYSLNDDKKKITIYSHAAIGLKTIKSLAAKFNVDYNDTTAEKLAQTIDEINVNFQEKVNADRVHTLYKRENMKRGFNVLNADLRSTPFEFIMWNRRYDHIDRPAQYNEYKLYFAHGHDTPPKNISNLNEAHIYNLDNQLGKGGSKGQYNALCTQFDVTIKKDEVKLFSQRENRHNLQNAIYKKTFNKSKLLVRVNHKEIKKLLASLKKYLETNHYDRLKFQIKNEILNGQFKYENLQKLREKVLNTEKKFLLNILLKDSDDKGPLKDEPNLRRMLKEMSQNELANLAEAREQSLNKNNLISV